LYHKSDLGLCIRLTDLPISLLLIVTKSFDVEMDLLYCLDKAESKKQWNFGHPNFDKTDANTILQAVRNVKKHNDALDLLEKY